MIARGIEAGRRPRRIAARFYESPVRDQRTRLMPLTGTPSSVHRRLRATFFATNNEEPSFRQREGLSRVECTFGDGFVGLRLDNGLESYASPPVVCRHNANMPRPTVRIALGSTALAWIIIHCPKRRYLPRSSCEQSIIPDLFTDCATKSRDRNYSANLYSVAADCHIRSWFLFFYKPFAFNI